MNQVHGNLSHAMRDNYAEHGVDEVLWTFLSRWWEEEGKQLYGSEGDDSVGKALRILDMAAGSGEATLCLQEWAKTGLQPSFKASPTPIPSVPAPPQLSAITSAQAGPSRAPFIPPNARRPPVIPVRPQGLGPRNTTSGRVFASSAPPTLPESFRIHIVATDPYTTPAYHERTGAVCHPLSFADLAAGQMPPEEKDAARGVESEQSGPVVWDLIVCSFALHLLTDPSELFALLYELSSKAPWLVVVAPHKKPEVKETWGWTRWDIARWEAAGERLYSRQVDDEDETELEIVRDKVKLRLYRSLNV